MDKIILIGFRCSGKTVIGKALAKNLGWDFIDIDEIIQEKFQKTIKEIVEEKGWKYFRDIEKNEIKKLINVKNAVIALGGGSVLHSEEMEQLKETGIIIWLYASPETILKRLNKDNKTQVQRPPLTDKSLEEEIKTVLKEREPLYAKFSHIKIDTSKASPEDIIKTIIKGVKNYES